MLVIDSAVDTTPAYVTNLPGSYLSSAARNITNLKAGLPAWLRASYPALGIESIKTQLDIQNNSISTVEFSSGPGSSHAALAKLEENVAQLWQSLDDDSFMATEQETEAARLLLEKFPGNTI